MKKIKTKRSILILAIATVAFILYYNYNYSQTAEPAGPVIKKIENGGKYCWRLPQVKAVPEARIALTGTVISLKEIEDSGMKMLSPVEMSVSWIDEQGNELNDTFRLVPHWRDSDLGPQIRKAKAGEDIELEGYLIRIMTEKTSPRSITEKQARGDTFCYVTSFTTS